MSYYKEMSMMSKGYAVSSQDMPMMYTIDSSVAMGAGMMNNVLVDTKLLNQKVMNEINLSLKQQGINIKEVVVLPMLDQESPYSGTINPGVVVPKILFLKEVNEEFQDRVYRLIIEEIRKAAGLV